MSSGQVLPGIAMFESTAEFRKFVAEKGERLRKWSYEDLRSLAPPNEYVRFSGRRGIVSVIVEECPDDRLRIVVQGFLDGRLLRGVKSVGLDGFYKHRDGAVSPMAHEEFYDYD